ncbi:MAG: PolC-type DNA polymerase III, partial [Lachnospiraceae bacterium]|nr:PolC-type DNA polymerase III [Lachnospiraceae bacterium]
IVISSDTPIPASVFSLEEIIRRQILKDRNIAVRLIGKVEVDPEAEQRAAQAAAGAVRGNGRPNGGWTRGGRGGGSGTGKRRRPKEEGILYGSTTEGRVTPIEMIQGETDDVVIEGEVFEVDERTIKTGNIVFTFAVTDKTDSIKGKIFVQPEEAAGVREFLKTGATLRIRARVSFDTFIHELALANVRGIRAIEKKETFREDRAPVKRVELHCHTKMSDMDGVSDVSDILKRAAAWGHKALAITDHGVVQAFPDAANTKLPDDFKIIYGMEGYLVDDTKELITRADDRTFRDTFVVFDIETTGLSYKRDQIIEIGAVKITDGQIVDRYSVFVRPTVRISPETTRLTHIEDYMVRDADPIEKVLPEFLDWCGDAVVVAHNAEFDTQFIAEFARRQGLPYEPVIADTLTLARMLVRDLKRYQLHILAKRLGVTLTQHHRAVYDAEATAGIFLKLAKMLAEQGCTTLRQVNELGAASDELIRKSKTWHIILIAKNDLGRVNLYRLVSLSHLKYFANRPRIPKSELIKYREGLIIGSACEAGELYRAIHDGESEERIRKIASFYDYLEIQPTGNDRFLIASEKSPVSSEEDLRNINRRIVALGEELRIPVCATCDVHFLDPDDEIYRRVIMAGMKFPDADDQAPLYLRTTDEMLEEFAYLGDEKAYEVVIENTNRIARMCEPIQPVRPDKNPPVIEHSEETLRELCYKTAHEWYGDELPAIVTDRLERELNSIISNGYAVMYIIAWELVKKSNEDGYLVGSRGSVGSSFVATMAKITEVNPLPPHYRCPNCKHSDFDDPACKENALGAGCDMPDKVCPVCGTLMLKDGYDIPFETFLGFKGDKEPDIDLNFSGEYQSRAHAQTEVIFGEGQTFRAGTVTGLADKTAYGFVKKYFEEHGVEKRGCEIDRLSKGCEGIRRSTGQHPGGIIVLPYGEDINTFTPVQHPANDTTTNTVTTHFDYHKIEQNLLKLDILGHDDPTMIRKLEDLTGLDATKIPLDDPQVMSLFKGTEALGVTPEQLLGCRLGVLGVPEFGTDFAMQMLIDAGPQNFADLVRIAGLAHGTDVWLGNTKDLILGGKATLRTAICTRDDIMLYLISTGLEPSMAFDIMENVRKGKVAKGQCGKWDAWKEEMQAHGVPDWYIGSCEKIKYMFPKAHAAAYVMMAWRVAWFKLNRPLEYYTSFFTIRASAFNYETMCLGKEILEENLGRLRNSETKLTAKDESTVRDMRIVQEMYARGFEFLPIDIYRADASSFRIIDGKIMPSLSSIDGMGTAAAESLMKAARDGEFLSRDDLRDRAKLSQPLVDKMASLGLLGSIPESNQFSFFSSLGIM